MCRGDELLLWLLCTWKISAESSPVGAKSRGTPYLWMWMGFCVGWAPTVQHFLWMDPAQLIWSGVCWVKKYISEGVPGHDLMEEREQKKAFLRVLFSLQGKAVSTLPRAIPGTVITLLCIKGEVCLCLTWSLGRWDVLSWEIVTFRLAALTAIVEHKFPLQCGHSNLPIFTQGNIFSAFMAFCSDSGLSNGSNGTDSSELSLWFPLYSINFKWRKVLVSQQNTEIIVIQGSYLY